MSLEDVRAVLADQIAEPASWRAVPVLDSDETAYVFTSPPDGWFQELAGGPAGPTPDGSLAHRGVGLGWP